MAEPILDQIVEAIADAVATVTTDNGYTTNLERVLRFYRDPESEALTTYACVVAARRRPLKKSFVGLTHEQARVEVYVFTALPSDQPNADQLLHRAESDVRKALAGATALIPGESATVDRLDWQGTEYQTLQDDTRVLGGIRLDFDLQYAVTTADPTISRSTP